MAGPIFKTNLFGQERDDVGIHPNSVGTAELENGSVTAAKLATSFPQGTLGYAENKTLSQSPITAPTELTGLSLAVTVPAGRRVRVTGRILASSTVATDRMDLQIRKAGVQAQLGINYPEIASGIVSLSTEFVDTPSAGTHTYALYLNRATGSGNLTAYGGSDYPAYILIEDITAITASQPIAVPTGLWRASADFPAAPAKGDLFYETDTDKLWAYNGTAWVELGRTGVWTDYVPTLTQSVTVSKTVNYARWVRFGRTIHAQWSLSATSAGTAGQAVIVSYPFATAHAGNRSAGTGYIYDASVNASYPGMTILANTGIAMQPTAVESGAFLGQGHFVVALASTDAIVGEVTYEAAAST